MNGKYYNINFTKLVKSFALGEMSILNAFNINKIANYMTGLTRDFLPKMQYHNPLRSIALKCVVDIDVRWK